MHYLRCAISCVIFFAVTSVWAAPAMEPFEVADRVAAAENPAWLDDYKQATKLFGKGRNEEKVADAATLYELIAYQGSVAAAIRLCVIYGHGVGHRVRPNTGTFWCDKALAAGYQGAAEIKLQLADKYWKPMDDVDFESLPEDKPADVPATSAAGKPEEKPAEMPAEKSAENSPAKPSANIPEKPADSSSAPYQKP